ncbi:hypothetical protein [Erythrobacter sp.]|uniref:hypothetical protein n=1 Tax=Erythrobacter sp. TaxID=1042 RepID=UPI001425FB5C|nr:hypothetical protein [Erythrobacter sp.]QIQ85245.1 MAG: hypothetical protein G9473_00040 [Erythrobacter sp.]QIQ87996.1 MAG: hypothetical protein G9473_15805 [Erythrobacter sp.]
MLGWFLIPAGALMALIGWINDQGSEEEDDIEQTFFLTMVGFDKKGQPIGWKRMEKFAFGKQLLVFGIILILIGIASFLI